MLPLAREGLLDLGVDAGSADTWLDIIRARTATGQNGARWQRAWVARHGQDMTALVNRYYELQQGEIPVHEWPL